MDIKNISYAAFRGLYDSFRGMFTIFYLDKEINQRTLSRLSPTRSNASLRRSYSRESTPSRKLKKHEESQVQYKVLQCGLLNGAIFLLSLFLFEYLVVPTTIKLTSYLVGEEPFMENVISYTKTFGVLFHSLWIIPLFFLSKFINAFWFQHIADSAYRYSRGRPLFMQSLSKLLADSIFSIVIETLFLIQAVISSYIPIYFVAYVVSLIQMCMLYSLYAFEYKWINMGWELHKRLDYIETNWPYFIGFGLPLAIFTQISGSLIISGCIFSILFPFFIISGNDSTPVTGACNYRLRLFSLVVVLSNVLFSKSVELTRSKSNVKPQQNKQS